MISEEINGIYERCGVAAYFGEPVSMVEHGLQAAYFARQAGMADTLVLAALLHDIGHLIEEVPADLADWQHDAKHELCGSRWLASRFGPEIAEPVRLHVPAKRYLCATDATYFGELSPASVVTFQLQGGPMSAAEVAGFEAEPYHRQAIEVRRCDDRGKVAGLVVPAFDSYLKLIEQLARGS